MNMITSMREHYTIEQLNVYELLHVYEVKSNCNEGKDSAIYMYQQPLISIQVFTSITTTQNVNHVIIKLLHTTSLLSICLF